MQLAPTFNPALEGVKRLSEQQRLVLPALSQEIDDCARADYRRILHGAVSVFLRHIAARLPDVLEVRLQRPAFD